jgi:hypothetical protein
MFTVIRAVLLKPLQYRDSESSGKRLRRRHPHTPRGNAGRRALLHRTGSFHRPGRHDPFRRDPA